LLVICVLTLVKCTAKSPSGQIFMTNAMGDGLYVYDFESRTMSVWERGKLQDFDSDGSHAWSPDYQQIVYNCYIAQHSNLCLYDIDTHSTEVLLATAPPYGEVYQSHPTWTLDGQGVTFVTTNDFPPLDQHYRQTLHTVDVQTRIVTQLADLPNALGNVTSLEWISENELLTGLSSSPGHILIWNTQTWEPRKVAEGLFPHWSPTTHQIVFMRYYWCLNEQTCFTQAPDRDTYWREISSRWEIYTVDALGENETLIYTSQSSLGIGFSSHGGLFWSPDGEYLAFTGGKGGEMNPLDLYIMRIADGYTERLVNGLAFNAFELSWIPGDLQ